MQKLLPIELTDFYIQFIGYALSILIMLWIKDAIGSFLEGIKFRTNKHFKEGDKVLLEGQQAMIITIGWKQTVFGVYGKDGYTWRFIPNKKIENLKLEKIVDPDLHPDTAIERAEKLQNILSKKS
jgi:small-conductance mechanosensitive channel